MSFIHDAISSILGSGSDYDWQKQLRAASFRGVPFAVINEETTHGRRQAIHEYPYRDDVYIEDLGRSTREINIQGFIVHDSLVYDAPDVITQRNSLTAACEMPGSGTLIHPTLGELTVSVPDGGFRISGSEEDGRAFMFSLTFIESGLRVFTIKTDKAAVKTNWLKLAIVTVLTVIATIKGVMRDITQVIKTIKSTIEFWKRFINGIGNEATNLSNTLKSTFGNQKYGRYNRGSIGGSASGISGTVRADDTESLQSLVNQKITESVMNKKDIDERLSSLTSPGSVDDYVNRVLDMVNAILNSSGGVYDRLRALEKMAALNYQSGPDDDRIVVSSIQLLIITLCAGGMASIAVDANPASREEAKAITDQVVKKLDEALLHSGNAGADSIYDELLNVKQSFISVMDDSFAGLADLMQVQYAKPLPALTVANRLYQDVSRSDELTQSANVPHPAFLPVKMKVLRK